ncbi:glycoside hydrolase family 76 protein [Kutzneria kofuensis]|uniref:Rhamnogalacturonyl hydrolase YesR n=1 Tax=Kutzneria kofuensis TaxID=103725 RepID=A0A7W9KGM8_9PSEU|nr:glycoside hydrolase family 76 protein [Kutzneria kofuensis]MBB5891843.1 rhamnogalacturonyl hydrolase YesR [Kutzneria kofuensis]
MIRLLPLLLIVLALPPAPAAAATTTVCALSCDTLDPSRAQQETFPLPDKNINGRKIQLHVSVPDGMAWASIDLGTTGDSVWLDRSWDGGATWEGLLGKAGIPGTWTGTRTLMYNIYDPVGHRRGVIRACGDANAVGCTDWLYPKVCDKMCDGANTPNGDTQPVAPTTIYGRTIRLHTDVNGMAWATIENNGPGDEVWLDRSWNEGASWPDGSSLGRTTSGRTTMFATRDPRAKLYGGAVRACGREASHANGSCTAWARPAPTRAGAAADALMYSYDTYQAWWPSSWWNSAATLTALINYAQRTGTHDYDWVVGRTFDVNRGSFPAGTKSSDPIEGDFISRAIDDSAWWGLAWIAAYEYTRDSRYLTEATTIANYVNGFWDPSTCGGGVWWNRERTYKNAVTSGLYLRLTAALHVDTPGDTVWGQRALIAGNWYLNSGLINASNQVNDGLTADCRNNGQTVWTYNQGLAIGGFDELYRATGDRRWLDAATRLGNAVGQGVLAESCEPNCDDNQKQFKGILVRYLSEPGYQPYLRTQADSLWANDRDSLNHLGLRWAGGTPNAVDWRTQASALEALTAVQTQPGPSPAGG